MKREITAAGLSLGLHAVLLGWLPGEAAPKQLVSPREPPMEVQMLKLPEAVGSPRSSPPTTAPSRRPINLASTPAAAGPSGETRTEVTAPPTGAAVEGLAEARPQGGGSEGLPQGESQAAQSDDGAPLDTAALSSRLQQVALRCYPPAARRFRQIGQAEVRFCLDASGALRMTTVTAGSGFELLDRAATECVVPGAAPFGPETFGRCFTVPVRFKP